MREDEFHKLILLFLNEKKSDFTAQYLIWVCCSVFPFAARWLASGSQVVIFAASIFVLPLSALLLVLPLSAVPVRLQSFGLILIFSPRSLIPAISHSSGSGLGSSGQQARQERLFHRSFCCLCWFLGCQPRLAAASSILSFLIVCGLPQVLAGIVFELSD
jgi:hypothetical protein